MKFLAILIIIGILIFMLAIRRRPLEPSDYLSVLSEHEWKSGRDVKIALEKAKGRSVSYRTLDVTMRRLHEENMVDQRDLQEVDEGSDASHPVREFKLTPLGARLKDEMRKM